MVEKEYFDAMDEMSDRVDAAIAASYANNKEKFVSALKCGNQNVVIYSACDFDEKDVPIDNLDVVPVKGTFIVVGEYDEFWDGRGVGIIGEPIGVQCGSEYKSEPITDPTWLQIAVLANESILTTNDLHHVFLENIRQVDDRLYLSFGS